MARMLVHDRHVELHPGKAVIQHTWFGFEIGQREEFAGVKAMFPARKSRSVEIRVLVPDGEDFEALGLFHASVDEYQRLLPAHSALFPKTLTAPPPGD